jgi:hypothetical protein
LQRNSGEFRYMIAIQCGSLTLHADTIFDAVASRALLRPSRVPIMGLFQFAWLPRVLFAITMSLALLLGTAVLAAPLAVRLSVAREVRLIRLFAHDATLRRISLASASGLAITAWVFFRPPRTPRKAPEKATHEAPAGMTGA